MNKEEKQPEADKPGLEEIGKGEQTSSAGRSEEDKTPRFMDIVFSTSAGALQGLGLGITDKEGEKPKVNLELARYSIGMLELLKVKTDGNLDGEESKFLEEMLHSLRLKYLEIANQAKEAS